MKYSEGVEKFGGGLRNFLGGGMRNFLGGGGEKFQGGVKFFRERLGIFWGAGLRFFRVGLGIIRRPG